MISNSNGHVNVFLLVSKTYLTLFYDGCIDEKERGQAGSSDDSVHFAENVGDRSNNLQVHLKALVRINLLVDLAVEV